VQEKNLRPRGRPKKDPNAPTQSYHLSSLERARRATQRKIKRNKTAIKNAEDKLRKHKQNVKKIEVTAKKIENGLSGKDTRVIDMGDVESTASPVEDLVQDQEVIFKPNNGPQEEFLSSSEEVFRFAC
jgi:hypothetical protein